MGNIAGYIANLGKSVSYSAVDKMKKMSPSSAEFASTNADLFKDVYKNVRDYKITYKRGMDIFSKSKVYEAGDVLKTSLIEDIKSGKLYNKEREDKMSMKFLGGSDDDGFDDSSLNIDFDDFDGFDFSDDDFGDITTGDKVVSTIIDKSNRKSAEMISMTTARTGEYIVENQKMSTNLLYTQNLQMHSMLQGNLTSINENVSTMLNFSDKVLKTHIENSSKYFEESTKLLQDQTALLREIVSYMKPTEKKGKQKDRITYDDIVGAEGTPDLKMYYKNVMKNITSNSSMGMLSSMGSMFGEDSNALAMLATSPLKFIPDMIVNSLVPKTIETSMQNLDKSLSNIFGSMMVKFNTMATSDDFLQSLIGKTFGVRSTAKDSIDTSKYEKGKVDWDGKSRKALIEVIPTHLAKIVSLLSGESEKIYDYDKGKFVSADSVKKEHDTRLNSYSKRATSDMHDYMKDYMKLLTFETKEERKKLQEDMEKFFEKLYKENRIFEVNSSTIDQDHMDYGIDAKSFRAIRAMFKNAPKYMQHQINSEILDNRNRQTKDFEDLENRSDSLIQYMYNGSNLNEYIKKNKLEKKSSSILTNSLNITTDNFGRNIFYYLQNMYRELSFIRQTGGMGKGTGRIQDPLKIQSSNGSTYSVQEKTINDIKISRNPKKPASEADVERNRREQERFRRSELRRREKNGDLINYSEFDDEKDLENNISAMIKLDQVNNRLKYEDSKKPTIIDKLLAAESLSEKSKIMIDKITDISKKPVEFVTSTIEKVDQRMYEFIYGKEDGNGNDIKGFLDLTLYELRNTFGKFNVFMDEKILTPLKDKLDVDSFKDGFKKLLSKMGIDTDEISKSVKEFFFGDKESGKQGIFSSTIDATKNSFKSAFGVVKDSLKTTLTPVINKGKELYKGKSKFAHLDNEDELDEFYDENGNVVKKKSNLQERIDNLVINSNITGRSQEYYDSLSFNSKEDELYFAKNNYISGQKSILNEKAELIQIDEKIKKLKFALRNSKGKASKELSKQIKQLEERKKFLKSNVANFYKSKNKYKGYLQDQKYNNINNYYKDSLSSIFGDESELGTEVINKLFDDNKSSFKEKVNFTAEDLMKTARELSLDKDEKYESIIDKVANHLDSFYNSELNVPLSKLADNNANRVLESDWYRTKGLPTNAEEFYQEFPNLINSSELLLEEVSESNDEQIPLIKQILEEIKTKSYNQFNEKIYNSLVNISKFGETVLTEMKDNQLPLIKQIANDLREFKDALFANIRNTMPKAPGPRIGLNPDILRHPEGGAIQTFSQDLVTMISNWMFGNTPKYDKGGYIADTTVATIGKGEVVLSAENVERLTSLFNDLIGGIKDKKKSSDLASTAFDSLLKISDEEGLNDLSTVKNLINSNPEMNKAIRGMDFTERRKYSSIMKSLDNSIKNRNNVDEKGVPLDPIQQALYEDTKPFVQKMGEELVSGLGSVKRSLLGDSDKEQSKAFGEVIDDVTKNVSTYAPDAIGKGLVGAGVSLLTGAIGGPLLGAAVGAGYSLTKNSEKVQNLLFGESVDGKRQGGLVSKKIIDLASKYLPDMKTYGITGALAGFLTPLGPIGGLMAGSALGFAKNNESVMSTLFGDQGLFKSESKDKLKKALPKVALGALAGGMMGPFGLLGNLVLGSGLGLVASTEDFKTAIFGRYDEKDNEFKGGLLPMMRKTIVDPLKEFGSEVKAGAMSYIKEHMLLPLTSAIDPIKKELSLIVKSTFDNIGDFIKNMFKDTIVAPISKLVEDKVVKPIGNFITKSIKSIFKAGVGLTTLPFKAVGAVGDSLRKKHVKQGNATYMTAEERLSYADEKGISYNNKFDTYLNSLSDEESNELFETLSSIENSRKSVRSLKKDIGKETGRTLSTYLDYDRTNDIMYQIKKGNLDKAKELVGKNKTLFGKKRYELNEDEEKEVMSFIDKQYDAYHNAENNRKTIDNKRYELYDELRKKGFTDINDKTVSKYLAMIDKERKSDKYKKEENKLSDPVLKIQQKNHNEIVTLIEKAINVMKGVEENTSVEEREVGEKQEEKGILEERNVVKNDENNLIKELAEAQTMTQIDSYGNVIELKRTSDGELEPDMSDSSTAKAINMAYEERESRKSFMSKMSEGFGLFKSSDEDGEGKKKGGLLGLLGTAISLFTKFLNPKTITSIATGIMAAPGMFKLLDAYNEGGLAGVVGSIPSIIADSVKTGMTTIFPEVFKGTFKLMENIGTEDDNVLTNTKDVMIRQAVTGGKLATAPEFMSKLATKSAKSASESLSFGAKAGKFIADHKGVKGIGKLALKINSPLTYAKGAMKTAASIPAAGLKLATKVGEKVNGLYNKIDDVSGLKSFRSKITESLTTKTYNTALNDVLNYSQSNSMISSLIKKLTEALNKLFDSKIVKNLIPEDKLARLSSEFIPKFVSGIANQLVKQGDKITAKIAGIMGTGGLLNIAFAVGDFVKGYNNAKDILSITDEPNMAMKIFCGILSAVNGLFIITSLIPEKVYVDIGLEAFKIIFNNDSSEIQQMRETAKIKAKEYAKENNIKGDFNVQDYNKAIREENKKKNPADRNGDGKVSVVEKVTNSVTKFTSSAWQKVKNIGTSVVSGVKKFLFGKGGSTSESMGKGDNGSSSSTYPSRLNNFTYYSQGDPRWNKETIGGTTVKRAGCGPTSMSMIVSELTGKPHTPDEFVKDAYAKGHWSKNGAQWTLFKYFADKYNLPYQEAGSYSRFQEFAAAGIPQAVSGRTNGATGTPFTSGGHIITVLGTDGNGNYIVNDPVSPARSKLYPEDKIKVGWRNSWGFGSPGTYDATTGISSSAQYSSNGTSTIEEESTQQTGLDMLFSDFTKAANSSFDKFHGLDELAGKGGDDITYDVNPLAATDYEDDRTAKIIRNEIDNNIIFANKINSTDKTNKPNPHKLSTNVLSNLRKKIFKENKKYTGMGGVDQTYKASASEIANQDLRKYTDISEAQFNEWLGTKKKNTKPFTNVDANIFLNASNKTGLDPRYIMAHAAWESAWGTSRIAKDKNNYYGIGAYNKSPYASAKTFNTAADGILAGAEWIKTNYTDRGQYTLNTMINDPSGNKHNYAVFDNGAPNTDWVKGISTIMASAPQSGKIVTSLSTSTPTSTEGETTEEGTKETGFDALFSELGNLFTGGFNKLYGLDELFPTTETTSTSTTDTASGGGVGELDPNAPKVADDWFTRTLNGRMTSKYGPRIHPIKGTKGVHTGIDYGADGGTPILSPVQGTVKHVASSSSGYGNRIEITDTLGGVHLFGHMKEKAKLKVGQKVDLNQEVGKVGTTGSSTGNHLHYEVRQGAATNKDHVDPNSYLSKYLDKIWSSDGNNGKASVTGIGGKGGVDQPLKNTKKYTGMGGVDQKYKAPKITLGNPIPATSANNTTDANSFSNKLLSAIIEILSKIANNTNCLTEIVQLLSNSLNIDLPEETVKQMKDNKVSGKSGTKQIITMIKDSVKDKDPGNEYLLRTLEQLAMD